MNADTPVPPSAASRFEEAIRRLDAANAADPNLETVAGQTWPRELLYAHRLYAWVLKLAPDASEALRLAARSQHLCRWMIPRSDYEATRAGYLKWRADLKQFHAQKAREILAGLGYPETIIAQVEALNLKKNFPSDPECRVLEDALCLVFLEHQLAGLSTRSAPEKMINALRKSWQKMTPRARDIALQLPLGAAEKELVARALAE